jgi:hypothetical protein
MNIIGFLHPDRDKERHLSLPDRLSQKAVIDGLFESPEKKPKQK